MDRAFFQLPYRKPRLISVLITSDNSPSMGYPSRFSYMCAHEKPRIVYWGKKDLGFLIGSTFDKRSLLTRYSKTGTPRQLSQPERTKTMNQSTINAIESLLKADASVTEEQTANILRCCKQSKTRRHLINAREAMTILSCSRPTLRFLVKQGRLQQINYSSRKARFDFDEVQNFANNGASLGTNGVTMETPRASN